LIISFIFYFKLFPNISRKSKLKGDFSYHLSIALRIILIITLVLCVKNQYLFTRGTFELIILIFIVLNLSRTSALKNKINGKE
jgi:FlaA1/EpsC-like NDP-sugar epimerase